MLKSHYYIIYGKLQFLKAPLYKLSSIIYLTLLRISLNLRYFFILTDRFTKLVYYYSALQLKCKQKASAAAEI